MFARNIMVEVVTERVICPLPMRSGLSVIPPKQGLAVLIS